MSRLPKNLRSTYQQYKIYTNSVAQWLVTTAKSRGYASSKSKKYSESAKAPKERSTYTIPLKEWIPIASFIAALVDPSVTVPTKLAALLDITILLRQSCSERITKSLADTADTKSNNRHAFFLGILMNVRSILSPLMSPAATKKPDTACIDDIFDMFEQLQLKKTSAAFEQSPDASPVSAPMYKAERPHNDEEDFFVLYLLFRDLDRLRTEVSKGWASYKHSGHDLIAASVTTNMAVDLARSMIEDLKSTFARHGGAITILQAYYAFQCIAKNTTEGRRQHLEDDMNFAMFKIADAMFWPAYILLDGFSRVHKEISHPEIKPGFYGAYDPSSNRDRKSDRDKFREDKILLLEMLSELYFHCHATKHDPPPVEDEFTRLLRTMFETKEVTLPVVFAATLFLEIHHILRAEVDYGFKSLTDATCFVISDIQEEMKFHKDIKMETWPKHNDDIMRRFVETIELWVHRDQQRKVAPQLNRNNTPEPFHIYRKHPWSCGLWRYWVLMQFHEFGIAFANAWGSIMSCAHLYNAVNGGKTQDMMWRDLDIVIGLQHRETFFFGKAPTTPDECLKRFTLAMGASAADLAKLTRTKRGLIYSKKGPKGLKGLGATMQAFKGRICNAGGPNGICAEDVQKILENSGWKYELDGHGNAQRVFKDIGETPKKTSARQLSVSKCVGLVRDLLHAEVVEIAFDYFRLHRQCWHLLHAIKDIFHDDLIHICGPNYLQKESELPSIVRYVLMSMSTTQKLAQLPKAKLPGVQVTNAVQEGARSVVKDLVQSKAGGLIIEQILPQVLGLQIIFKKEEDSG